MPNNYRHNPFNDVSTAILVDETHIVPSTSPFYVRLNEIPQKNSPSTVAVKEITGYNADGPILGTTFAEVAANPAQGQVRLDYSTSADNDENWNTGLLQFNAADAGKIIEVTYTATGTLASVEAPINAPPWAYDRGDGSDGDFVASGGETIGGVKNYRSFVIPAGKTVKLDWEPLILKCQTAVIIQGTLDGRGNKGRSANTQLPYTEPVGGSGIGEAYIGTAAPYLSKTAYEQRLGTGGGGGGRGRTVSGEKGASSGSIYAGNTVVADNNATPNALRIEMMAQTLLPKAGGGGGCGDGNDASGAGGGGGGTITVAADYVSSNLTFDVSGGLRSQPVYNSNNRGSAGGSGGGSIHIIAKYVVGLGQITVKGGQGGDCDKPASEPTNGAAGWYKIFSTKGA